jgi:nucleotide-binding universal stress UspA family protein
VDRQRTNRPVVVGVDGSDDAARAVLWGAAEAHRRRLPLRLVAAFPWTIDRAVGQVGPGDRHRDIVLDRTRTALATARDAATSRYPQLELSHQIVVGDPDDVLAAEGRHAHMLVLGDRGLSRIEGMLVGSTAVAMATHASCPVAIVRGRDLDATDRSLPVVVGADGSRVTDAAIAFAFEAAAERRVPLVAVHTWWDTFLYPAPGVQAYVDGRQTIMRQQLAERIGEWAVKFPDVQVEQITARDHPARLLLELTARSQLAVVGSRGHGEFIGMILGSVSNALVHKASCPVVVVRPDPTETA